SASLSRTPPPLSRPSASAGRPEEVPMMTIVQSAAPIPAPRLTRTAIGPVEHIDSGAGPALLALHGGMGGYDQGWLLGRALLAEPDRWRLVAPSRPGYLGTANRL